MSPDLALYLTPLLIAALGVFIRREFGRIDSHFARFHSLHESHHTRLTKIETRCQYQHHAPNEPTRHPQPDAIM